jgi:hypothetical protein
MLIFSTAAHRDKKKRDFEVEVDFNGDHKAWLEHTWRKEKRSLNLSSCTSGGGLATPENGGTSKGRSMSTIRAFDTSLIMTCNKHSLRNAL